MSNFLIAAVIVFMISMIVFSAVFIMAVKLRLLPAQAGVTELVDGIFNIFRSQHTAELTPKAATSAAKWVGVSTGPNFSLGALGTVAVATIIILSPVDTRPSVSMQIGRTLKSDLRQTIAPQHYIVMEASVNT